MNLHLHRRTAKNWLFAVAMTCVLLVHCGRRDGAIADLPMPPTTTGTASLHAVHNAQLREVMAGLRTVAFSRLPQELDDPSREGARLEEAGSVARDLAQAADRIAGIAGETGLTEEEQKTFVSLADRLRNSALQLEKQADRRQTRLLNGTMNEINQTCTECHTLFRDAPGSPASGTP